MVLPNTEYSATEKLNVIYAPENISRNNVDQNGG